MAKATLEIHSENILPIIKKWLYSDKDIFVRELVSNACDAIHKVQILAENGELQVDKEQFRIDVTINKEARTLTFTDTGIGMTEEEVQRYIAQIAFSSAEEFMEKYKSQQEGDQFIGHFGLGFYSAYMVAAKVEIDTLSYKPHVKPAFWSCDGSREYTLEEGKRTERGTQITLFIDNDNDEYLEESHLRKILKEYCSFLPYPIYLNGERINTHEPLWMRSPVDCKEEDYLEFYRHLYPTEEDPLFWIHLNVDYPFHLKGILFFPKLKKDFDLNKSNIQLYCNRVFVSDNCKDVIPQYLTVLQGVIDSPDIPLNVSRSSLQMDKTVRQLSGHISKKVSDSLNTLYKNDKEKYFSCWDDISLVVKLGVLEDEKFYDRVKDIILWQNLDKAWTTVPEYLEKHNQEYANKVYYTRSESNNTLLIDMWRKKNIEILSAPSSIDGYLIQHLERKLSPVVFLRIDASIEDHLIDKDREKIIVDEAGKTEAVKLAELVKNKLEKDTVEVEAKSLISDDLPAFVVIDEQQRRMRDYLLAMNPKGIADGMMNFIKQTLVINTNNPLISALPKLEKINPQLTSEIVKQIQELALLSQHEMDPSNLNHFIHRTNHVIEKLAEQVVKDHAEDNKQ